VKIIIRSLKSENIRPLESEKSGTYWVPNRKKTLLYQKCWFHLK